jgi:hypothetical protein
MHRRLALVLALAGCGKAEDRPELEQPTDENRADYRAISSRVERFVDAHGYVIARDAAGNEKHQGDGLWRSGIALANLPCDMGLGIERALQDMTRSLGGALWRHPTQPERMSLDQALGFYYGAAARVTRCPETAAAWREALALHKDYLEANDGQLNPVDGAKLTAPFTAVRDALFSAVNLADGPSGPRGNGCRVDAGDQDSKGSLLPGQPVVDEPSDRRVCRLQRLGLRPQPILRGCRGYRPPPG